MVCINIIPWLITCIIGWPIYKGNPESYICRWCTFHVVNDIHSLGNASQDNGKINYNRKDISDFWTHWECHEPVQHPAAASKQHMPVGLAGDDAKYTLSGSKLIVMLLSFPIQNVMRTSA